MEILLYLILSICIRFSFSLDIAKEMQEIKYTLKRVQPSNYKKGFLKNKIIDNNKDEKVPNEKSLNRNNIIELEPNTIATKISWTKTDDYNLNYLLGIFEGSKDESFLDSIPIAIIKEPLNINEINNIYLNIPNAYKYIRFVPPNENNTDIILIKIYGYKLLLKSNLNDDGYFQITNLPLISINTEEAMEPQKDSDINCYIKIINEGRLENSENAAIKIRGRSTSMISSKKPYRIKFATKQKILNIKGKEKKWTLIANYLDRSLLRNQLAFKLSELMEFKYTPRCQPVDVILNGNFRGNYYICDKIEVGENRVNISKMEETDISEPNITGGYFLKIDGLALSYENNYFLTDKGIIGNIEYPEDDEINSVQKSYIISKLNQFENEIYNSILDSIDLKSYSKFFLVEEFCGNPDHVWSSFYFTKERNDDKFYFGPVWDFDLGFDNDDRLIPTNNKTDFCFNYGASAGTTQQFINTLIGNKNVIGYIKNTWDELCNNILNENILLDYIEEKRQYIKESAELNFLRWYNSDEPDVDFGRKDKTFEIAVDVIKDYVKNRFTSLSNLINKRIYSIKE